ncbi:MAG: hypothetical protein QXW58_06070 [Thermosphaera sp.]
MKEEVLLKIINEKPLLTLEAFNKIIERMKNIGTEVDTVGINMMTGEIFINSRLIGGIWEEIVGEEITKS